MDLVLLFQLSPFNTDFLGATEVELGLRRDNLGLQFLDVILIDTCRVVRFNFCQLVFLLLVDTLEDALNIFHHALLSLVLV